MFYSADVFIDHQNKGYYVKTTFTVKKENAIILYWESIKEKQSDIQERDIYNDYKGIISVLEKFIRENIRVREIRFYINSQQAINLIQNINGLRNPKIRHLISTILFLQKKLDVYLFFKINETHKRILHVREAVATLVLSTFMFFAATHNVYSQNIQAKKPLPNFLITKNIGTNRIVMESPVYNPYYSVLSDRNVIMPTFKGLWFIKKRRED